jgi:hypothetical protein
MKAKKPRHLDPVQLTLAKEENPWRRATRASRINPQSATWAGLRSLKEIDVSRGGLGPWNYLPW